MIRRGMRCDITIRFRSGVYYLGSTLKMGPADWGKMASGSYMRVIRVSTLPSAVENPSRVGAYTTKLAIFIALK